MNGETMVISAFGFVDGTDYGGSLLDGAIRPLPPGPFDDLRWDEFSERPYKRYGRLDILSRYAAVAVELLGLVPFTESQSDMALVMGTEQGCLAVDLDFRNSMDQEGGGSPLLFMYTLHNACMGEIAIRYNITGPNLCLIAGEESGLSAIWEGLRLIRCGEAQSCVCLAADGLGDRVKVHKETTPTDCAESIGSAYCILVESARQAAHRGVEPLAKIREFKGGVIDATHELSCRTQLAKLQRYLSGNQLNIDQDSRLELHLSLYHRNDLLYIDCY